MKVIKILTISDHILSTSGVAHQMFNVIKSLLDNTKDFQFISLCGAIKHAEYKIQKLEEYGDRLVMIPVDNFGSKEEIRSVIRNNRPDILFYMGDPRFFSEGLHEIAHEIRKHVPMVWLNIWDNYPIPYFNKPFYESNDVLLPITKLTEDINKKVAPNVECIHMPHVVNDEIFKKLPREEIKKFKTQLFQQNNKTMDSNKLIFFWNNRNARRKQSGTLIFWFKEFLDIIGHDKATLLMHTDPLDPNGQNLNDIIEHLNLLNGQVLISQQKLPQEMLAKIYNMVDCTINIAHSEGWGLSSQESLCCETPVINTITGGLQEQVSDGKNCFGVGIEPVAKPIVGSLQIPFIYEDHIRKEDFIAALKEVYEMTGSERDKLGEEGRKHILKNFNYKKMSDKWVEVMRGVHEKYGSWEGRKKYKSWVCKEV